MAHKERERREGVVVEALPDGHFRVLLEGEEEPVLAVVAGKLRYHRISILIGDLVTVELDEYGGKPRIVHRHLQPRT